MEIFNNLVGIESAFKGQLYDQAIVDIFTEGKYPGGIYYILDLDKKEIVQQASKGHYLACSFICHSDSKKYGRLID